MQDVPPCPVDEAGRLAWIREHLYVPAVCDILDDLGRRDRAMHQRLRPLDPDDCQIVGRARTFRWMEVDYVPESDPYDREIEVMDSLGVGDVAVHSSDPGFTNAPWGELMSTLAKRNGSVGCVCDSMVRDCRRIMAMRFPVFAAGIRPLDSKGRGKVMAYDVPIRCGGVLVRPRELVFADYDGIVVIPRELEDEVLRLAADKVGRENATRRELLKGRTLRDVYDEFGVL
ncbi:RraA family protein [Aquisphaera insulae]|uniref:RraA family protein n=1 Tax=Aquisphaera insulae TaxID=2712864 RepID=UPI0013EC6C30|nr:RraA family protein [Aquisphaera insulae]